MSYPSIYISIASYEDPLLAWTINHAWEQATHPERLSFGIVEQAHHTLPQCKNGDYLQSVPWRNQIRYLGFSPLFARGPCWARSIGFSLYAGEDFLLQLDSHMYFESGWDELLLSQFHDCERNRGHNRLILSTYPDGFSIENGAPVLTQSASGIIVLRPKPQECLSPDHPVLMFHGIPTSGSEPVEGCHVGAGCLFASASLVEQVPYDPWLYFHGEEQNLAVRAWTHGYDIMHPVHMPIRHHYKSPEHNVPVHWREEEDKLRTQRWWELEYKSRSRMANLLYRNMDLGKYGLGQARSLNDFAQFSGIDYTSKTISRFPTEVIDQP